MEASDDSDLKRSPLDGEHVALGARMAPFGGWSMPIQYAGVLPEHQAVRDTVGVFDISHMGQLWIEGAGDDAEGAAVEWLNHLLCNDVSVLLPGEGQYTLMLNESGGVIDDLLIYRISESRFFLVVNAARIDEDLAHMQAMLESVENVSLENASEATAGIAVQGPNCLSTFAEMIAGLDLKHVELPPRNEILVVGEGDEAFQVCRTGYTGEDGFELFCGASQVSTWWQRALAAEATPCGLGARDTLRLEKCYPLNGSDLDETHTPLEAGLGFFVAMEKGDFVGRDVLAAQKENGLENRLVALRMVGKAPPPRPSYEVFETDGDTRLGVLTSGTLSPTLGAGIAMAYLPAKWAKAGAEVSIDIRGRRFPAQVVKKPFVKSER